MTDREKKLIDYVYGKMQDIYDYCDRNNIENVRIYASNIQKGSLEGFDMDWLSADCIFKENDKEKVITRSTPITGNAPRYSEYYRGGHK